MWEILAADEEIDECPRFELLLESLSDGPTISKRIDFENRTNSELFLEYFWPDMTGKAARMDEHYLDTRVECYTTVKDRRIKFNDPN